MRSAVVHSTSKEGANWGWTLFKHLRMGAFVFPLLCKILLQKDSDYKLISEDQAKLRAIDRLLMFESAQAQDNETDVPSNWVSVVCDEIVNTMIDSCLSSPPNSVVDS